MRGIITVSLDPISYQEELGGPNIVSTVRAAPLPLITPLRSRQLSSSALSLPVSPCLSLCVCVPLRVTFLISQFLSRNVSFVPICFRLKVM